MKDRQEYLSEEQIAFLLRCKKEQNLSPEECDILDGIIKDFSKPKGQIVQDNSPEDSILVRRIIDTELSTRSKNALVRSGLVILRDIVQMTEDDLNHVRNAGKKVQTEVKEFLAKNNLSLSRYTVYPSYTEGDEVEVFGESIRSYTRNSYTGGYNYAKKGERLRIIKIYNKVVTPIYSPFRLGCADKNGIEYYCSLGQICQPHDKEQACV